MKIVLITTSPDLGENGRIAEEVRNLGYKFALFNWKDLEFGIINNELSIKDFEVGQDDIVISRAIFRSIHIISSILISLRKRRIRVFDNNFLKHKYSINKLSDMIKLNQSGLPVPKTYHLHLFEKYFEISKKLKFPFVLKLARSGKGVGVHKIENIKMLSKFIKVLKRKGIEPKSYLAQEFIPYEFDLRVLLIGDKIFCMRRIPKKGEFRANFSLGGSVENFELDEFSKKLAFSAAKAVDLEVAGVDMLITKEGKRYILEVNHTPGMLGMEKATGENITKYYLEYAIKNAR